MEFYVTTVKKFPDKIPVESVEEIIDGLGTWRCFAPKIGDIKKTIRLSKKYSISFWHALIVHAAQSLDATIIWTEDLQNGRDFDGVLVRNPFV